MSTQVLITGASGLIGSRLTTKLLDQGYQVSHLSRGVKSKKKVKSYIWNIKEGFIEEGALESANIVIHLAGAGVADKRWSAARKREILQSRLASTALLHNKLQFVKHQCQAFVSASAIGFYGWDTGETWVDESSPRGQGFLAEVTEKWELAVSKLQELDLRVVMLRIGIVLSTEGGALPKMAQPLRFHAGAPLGSGQQYMSWIHIDDLCNMFIKAVQDQQMTGAFNAVAPKPVTNKVFTKQLAEVLDSRLWLPAVPAWVLKLTLGEMAQIILGGNRVSSRKIESMGFNFKFVEIESALKALLNR